jgi:hypothetical protein
MNTKLTLVMESDVIYAAKAYAGRHGTSVSKMVEQYLQLVSSSETNADLPSPKRGPLTSALAGAIRPLNGEEVNLSSKELIQNAKAERFD